MVLAVNHLTGFGAGAAGGGAASVLVTPVVKTQSAGLGADQLSIDIPTTGSNRIIIAGITIKDAASGQYTVTSTTVLDAGGAAISLGRRAHLHDGLNGASIVSAALPNGYGGNGLTLDVDWFLTADSSAIWALVVSNIGSAIPTFTGSRQLTKAQQFQVLSVTCQPGGFCIGALCQQERSTTMTWGNILTERLDASSGGLSTDHRYSCGYDTLSAGRTASTEIVTASENTSGVAVVASFR